MIVITYNIYGFFIGRKKGAGIIYCANMKDAIEHLQHVQDTLNIADIRVTKI